MTTYAVLPGFGIFDESKKDYRDYLDRFVALVKKKNVSEVVLCGGATDSGAPGKTEAGTMAEYLRPLLDPDIRVHLEDRSLSSKENVEFAKRFLDLEGGNHVFLVSDGVRFFKMMWFVLHFWFGMGETEIAKYWHDLQEEIYANPKKPDRALRLREISRRLRYKNVAVIIDKIHRSYREAVHPLVTDTLEIEALYDKDIETLAADITRIKTSRLGI